MKKPLSVLMATDASQNPYVIEIVSGIRDYEQVTCSVESFFEKKDHFDIVHIQWPEELTGWSPPDKKHMEMISEALAFWKVNAKIVVNRHNLEVLEKHPERSISLYNLVYEYADAIIHLGDFDFEDFQRQFQKARHWVIPHHIYKHYLNESDWMSSRNRLEIPEEKRVILCFGHIRNEKERRFIRKSFHQLKLKNKLLLAPSYWRGDSALQRLIARWKFYISGRLLNMFYAMRVGNGYISDKDIQHYFNAADIIFIPRQKQLNSGVVFLALAFGKVIVGPDFGNTGEIIKELNYPVYSPGDAGSAATSLKEGARMKQAHTMEEILTVHPEFSLDYSIQEHIALYKKITEKVFPRS